MISRCYNRDQPSFKDYGGRGISVCDRWRRSFTAFLKDVGERPSSEHSIDRFPNNDGNYEPGNVRWATRDQQNRNKRNNHWLTHGEITLTIGDWAKALGMKETALRYRLNSLPLHVALSPQPSDIDPNSAGSRLASERWRTASPDERKAFGQIRSKPTPCPKCGKLQPTARQARVHCRKPRKTH